MFIKPTRSGGHTYLQLVESFRNDAGQPRQRTVATLGRLDEVGGGVDSLLAGLLRAKGLPASAAAPPQLEFDSALSFGDVWALEQLWHELGFDNLAGVFHKARFTTAVEHALRVMVFNRLCDPESKLGVLRWLQTVHMPSVDTAALTHQQLLRSMDALMDHQSAVDGVVAGLLRPLVDQDMSLVFYDLTTIRAAGLSEQQDDVRQFGMSKEGLIARQFMLGVVQTAEGLPLYHEVFDGNASETKTLLPTLTTVLARFPSVRRLILIADRGLLSLDNLESLQAIVLSSGQPLEFIIAVPGRRYADFVELLGDFHRSRCTSASAEIIDELTWNDLRLVVAHDPAMAAIQTQRRSERIDALIAQGEQWAGKLVEQDEGVKKRGRKLSDSGAKARFFHAVSEAHLSKIIKVNLAEELFSYDIDANARSLAEMMDGKLLLVTNVQGLTPADIVIRYKSLADIERGFKVLKSEIEIGPVYHRLPERIKAHASICFMALILHRVMRSRLRAANAGLTPERALEQLRRIQHHRIRLNGATPVAGVSSINDQQSEVLNALRVKKPDVSQQLTLL